MNPRKNYMAAVGFTRREGLIALIGGMAALSGCGGGGTSGSSGSSGIASVGSGGTGSFSSGAITGFGSIIVNGVRFDDSKATITDDDGASRNSGDLKLGMVVSIAGSAIVAGTNGSSATASSITFGSELRGPIDSIGSQSLVVLGQTVQVGANTVFDSAIAGGLARLSVGQVIEVHGFVDPAANTMLATRIERTGNNTFKLQGVVQALDTNARTFAIGTLTISYAGIATNDLPTLANGLLVRVRLAATPATGTRTATRIRAVARQVEDHDEAELEGTVTAFTSTSTFSVNGIAVDAGKATFPNGTAGLRLGARVEVEGHVTNGVLVAATVKLEDEDKDEDKEKFELHGTISNLDTTNKTFVIRGVTVSFAGTVRFDKGDASTLAAVNGTNTTIEVRGTNSAATNSVIATRIRFEN
jgi:hypothetical protein